MICCYVLGAGFSAACGFPVARDLTERVFSHAFPQGVNDEFREAYLMLMKTWFPRCDCQSSWPHIEELLTALDEWEHLVLSAHPDLELREGEPSPQHLKDVLVRHTDRVLCDSLQGVEERESFTAVTDFVSHVAESGATIISFNWDLLIEKACTNLGLDCAYGLEQESGVRLIKPHGSQNVPYVEENGSATYRMAKLDSASSRAIYREPLIVPPAMRKSYEHPWIKFQWTCAYKALASAETIVVIGYSLPLTDVRPRLLFQLTAGRLGVESEGATPITIVDPSRKVCERFRRLVSAPTLCVEKNWIEWFARQPVDTS